MSQQPPRSDPFTGEVRLRVPLPILIPVGAVVLIAVLTVGFSRVLLSIPPEAATTVAVATAVNILGACAVIAGRRRLTQSSLAELAVVVLYPVIIGIVLASLNIGEGEATEPPGGGEQPPAGAPNAVVAENSQFSTDTLTITPEGGQATIDLTNNDTVEHNVSLYESEADADAQQNHVFEGDTIADTSVTYEFAAPDPGDYVFQCDIHPTMRGTATVEEAGGGGGGG
jgi:plastocyanin